MNRRRDRRSLYNAATREPFDPRAHERLARCLLAEQDLAALAALRPVLAERFADHAFTHLIAGHAAKAAGDSEAAAQHYRRALELEPTSGEALYNLVDLGSEHVGEAMERSIALLADREGLRPEDRINICFARGRMLERSGDAGGAYEYYRSANELALELLASRGIRYDPHAARAQLEADLANWPPATFADPLPSAGIDLTPVFVIGLPRSGTTLVERILGKHSQARAGGELTLGHEVEHDCRRRLGLGPSDPLYAVAGTARRGALERAREQYLDGLFARGLDARWVIDKLPANARIAGFLRLIFPDAPIVHCRRDPRALAWSLYTANFAAHEAWYHDLDAIEDAMECHSRLMAHWRRVLPPPFADIDYESLVQDPENQIPALLTACGMPFDGATLSPETLDQPVFTASHADVRRPIHTGAIDRWRPQADHLMRFAPRERRE